MEFLKVITERRSIRKFKPDEVPDEIIHALIEAARLAPSGENCQPWRFVVIKNQECKDRLAEVVPQSFATRVPLIIA
ncbi:MAG TPA: nitroreductase family protein, partial [Smithella sp.]|nr:nitroreductase family protein [Smithella sp.]